MRTVGSMGHRSAGFTLIEVMITVAIIGILAAIAMPSYVEYIAKGRRADARTQLLAAQQWMERLYSESYTYERSASGTAVATLLAAQPFAKSPREGAVAYAVSASGVTATGYTLLATRTGSALADKCGDFTLSHTGRKSVVDYNSSKFSSADDAAQACWK